MPVDTTTTSPNKMNTFPQKLYHLLEQAESIGFAHIISWQSGGKSFRVWNPKLLESRILPSHFRQSKFKSFLRQLNTYQFQRITSGVNRGGYTHPYFIKGEPQLCKSIKRDRTEQPMTPLPPNENKGDNLHQEMFPIPNKSLFDTRDTLGPLPFDLSGDVIDKESRTHKSGAITTNDLDEFVDLFEPISHGDPPDNDPSRLHPRAESDFVAESNVNDIMSGTSSSSEISQSSSSCQTPAELEPIPVMTPSLPTPVADAPAIPSIVEPSSPTVSSLSSPQAQTQLCSTAAAPEPAPLMVGSLAAAPVPIPTPEPITFKASSIGNDLNRSESTFPLKVFRMLQDVEKLGKDHIVSWINEGSAFQVHDQDAFVNEILPLYFDQTVYESFRRQLNMYSFTRVTRGPLKGTCYHKLFRRSQPELVEKISRRKRSKNQNNIGGQKSKRSLLMRNAKTGSVRFL